MSIEREYASNLCFSCLLGSSFKKAIGTIGETPAQLIVAGKSAVERGAFGLSASKHAAGLWHQAGRRWGVETALSCRELRAEHMELAQSSGPAETSSHT